MTMMKTTLSTAFAVFVLAGSIVGCAGHPEESRYRDSRAQHGPNQDRLERTDSQMGVTSDSGTFDYKK